MMMRDLIGRILAVFLIAGLIAAPLVSPAAAKPMAASQIVDMSAMPADMPCCPDEPKTDGCKDCPLLALCMLTVAQMTPAPAGGIQTAVGTRRLSFALYDLQADGLAGVPPDHPPRTSI
jgi:hypothetical protein